MGIIKLGDLRKNPEDRDVVELADELAGEERYRMFFPGKQNTLPDTKEEVDTFYRQAFVPDDENLKESYLRKAEFHGLQSPVSSEIKTDSLEGFLRTEINASLNILKKEISPDEFLRYSEKKKYNIFLDRIYETKPCFFEPRENLLEAFKKLKIIKPKYFRPGRSKYNGLKILRKNI